MNNVVIYKPGTAGYENAPVVIIQGHMDMVCEKRPDVEHDFTKDGLNLSVEGDYKQQQFRHHHQGLFRLQRIMI